MRAVKGKKAKGRAKPGKASKGSSISKKAVSKKAVSKKTRKPLGPAKSAGKGKSKAAKPAKRAASKARPRAASIKPAAAKPARKMSAKPALSREHAGRPLPPKLRGGQVGKPLAAPKHPVGAPARGSHHMPPPPPSRRGVEDKGRPAAPHSAKSSAAPARGGRRPRLRITGDGTATANWLNNGEKPRPSSFIPAPPRAESAFSVAAPPASSDRLIRPEDLKAVHAGLRTYTVRVDIEQGGGKTTLGIYPSEIAIRSGEGIEWDFRYLGGADATVDEVVIEFDKPSPFGSASFRSRKPGGNRPHRHVSGPASPASANKRVTYTIRCFNLVKAEISKTRPVVTITPS